MWEIFTYQNNASLAGIFNAIAAISGAQDYRSALALTLYFGFGAAALAYAITPQKLEGWKWLASATLVMSVLFVPRTTVLVTDKSGVEAPQAIDNIPLGLAVLAGATSAVGNTLTQLFETAFQLIPQGRGALPQALTYQRNGLVFGSRLVAQTQDAVFRDPVFRTNLIRFLNDCVMPDVASGHLSATRLEFSKDLWADYGDTNPARFSSLTSDHGVDVRPCPDVYAKLGEQMAANADRAFDQLAAIAHPLMTLAEARERTDAELVTAAVSLRIVDASTNARQIVVQSALINAMRERAMMAGIVTDDNAAITVGRAQASALQETNAAWLNNAKLAEQALPMVRSVIEALSYALFPFVILLMLLTNGQQTVAALRNYASILIWIQLWPPLYAVLNYMAVVYQQYDLAAAALLQDQTYGLTLSTMDALKGTALSGQAVVGYLTMGIPMLAWAALKRMENLGSSMVGGIAQLQASINGNSAAAAEGNYSAGAISLGQQQASPTQTSPMYASRQDPISGNTTTSQVAGAALPAISILGHKSLNQWTTKTAVTHSDVESAERAVSAASGQAKTASEGAVAAGMERLAFLRSRQENQGNSNTVDSAASKRVSQTLAAHDRVTKALMQATGVDENVARNIAAGMGAKVLTNNAGVAFAWARSKVDRWDEKYDQAIAEDLATMVSADGALNHRIGTSSTNATGTGLSDETSANFTRALSVAKQKEARYAEALKHAETLSYAHTHGVEISTSHGADRSTPVATILELNEGAHGSPEAARIRQEGYFANFQLKPNTSYADGEPAPVNDMAVRGAYDRMHVHGEVEARARYQGDDANIKQMGARVHTGVTPADPPAPAAPAMPAGPVPEVPAYQHTTPYKAQGDAVGEQVYTQLHKPFMTTLPNDAANSVTNIVSTLPAIGSIFFDAAAAGATWPGNVGQGEMEKQVAQYWKDHPEVAPPPRGPYKPGNLVVPAVVSQKAAPDGKR